MTVEASEPPFEFGGLGAASPENAGYADDSHAISQHGEFTDEEQRINELRAIFIANGDPIEVNLKTQAIPNSAEIEAWRFSTGLAKVGIKLNQEARKGIIGLDEIIEAGRIFALVIGDDTFEEKLAIVTETMDCLTPGSYVFPINIIHDFTSTTDEATSDAEASFASVCPSVGRVTAGLDGQPAIIPRVWIRTDSLGVTRAEISLNVTVDLGDDTEFEVELDLFSGTPENINVDPSSIRSALKKHIREVLSSHEPEVLDIQSLAESFGLIGDTKMKDKLQQVAHEHAIKQFDELLSGAYLNNRVRAVWYLMFYNPELMDEKYDQYARDYAETGAIFGDSGNNRVAELFFTIYTSGTEWIANRGGKTTTIMEPYDDPIPYPGLFRTEALQKFLERGRQLAEEKLAAELRAIQFERPIADVHLPETDLS